METLDYLLGAEPWLQYAVRVNLLGEPKEALAPLKEAALGDGKIKAWLRDVADFHGTLVSAHKNPGLPIHKLMFLLDIGLGTEVPELRAAVDAILSRRDAHGIYQSPANVSKHFGGSGENTFGWALCDAPLMSAALLMAGVPYETVRPGVAHMAALLRDNGFPCAVSGELGSFRGPGRKDDCCPYATLAMLRLFSYIPEYRDGDEARTCAETLLALWEHSREQHPYMFFMGTDFRKLKAPPIWYDIVGVTDCLSRFDAAVKDARFREMLSCIADKRDGNGLFTPEAVYLKCKDWDFGQKKAPSPYLTYCCLRILQRAGGIK